MNSAVDENFKKGHSKLTMSQFSELVIHFQSRLIFTEKINDCYFLSEKVRGSSKIGTFWYTVTNKQLFQTNY